jgi:enoyl-CoA hydratase/carnithine racemase
VSGGTLHVEDGAHGVRVLTLSQPKKRNALDGQMLRGLREALDTPPGIGALLIRGEGEQAFCSGYDLGQLGQGLSEGELPDDFLGEVLHQLEAHALPTVALVHGPAFGAGCELAIRCDFRIGDASAVFCMPPARLGVLYAPDGLWRMTQLLGVARAKWMFLSARKVGAGIAREWGLLDAQHATVAEARADAEALAAELAQNAPLAVRGMKRAFGMLTASPLRADDREALRALRKAAYASEDAREGRAAFLEKRSPRFTGR